jgi:DNA/RNA-binding domain of Phe-tRNA-synthetase-like protein
MFEVTIDHSIKNAAPGLLLGCISARVTVSENNAALWRELEVKQATMHSLDAAQISALPQVSAQQYAYRKAGKNPVHHRGSNEVLMRRIVEGQGINHVNTLVDVIHLISLETHNPVCCYDCSELDPPIVCQLGEPHTFYDDENDVEIELENLPLLVDGLGPFGSPNGDSKRALVQLDTKDLLMIMFAFEGNPGLEKAMLDRAAGLLRRFAAATDVDIWLIT